MSAQQQRSRPEQIERFVTKLAEDVHNAVGGRVFPAKLVQTAVAVLSNDKAVSSEKWERVRERTRRWSRVFAWRLNEGFPVAGCADSQKQPVCSKRTPASAKSGRAGAKTVAFDTAM